MADAVGSRGSAAGMAVLSEDECWALLRAKDIGRIAVVVGSTPDIFPVNYAVHEGEIVIHTEAGTKLAGATMMPAVAFEVDGVDAEHEKAWSVVVKGHGREPASTDEVVALDALDLDPWVDSPKSRWLVIAPHEVTGRRII
jgi:nitroimidazol reductase NimA-like FMN-containing flavoprotein (pyridoxamine 5'-phosphate oxidase superfamily)